MKDTVGRYLTRALFVELASTSTKEKYPPIFTLAEARAVYLECADPTEYEPAIELLGSWDHWQALIESPEVRIHVDKWRDELEVVLRSKSIKDIKDIAKTDKGFQAAKWLADKGWDKTAVGRPSKARVKKEKRIRSDITEEINEDAKRLSLTN